MDKILVLSNSAAGLYLFRRELICALADRFDIVAAVPDDGRYAARLRNLGCRIVHTQVDRRGTDPFRDMKLCFRYRNLLRSEKPVFVISYTIKPNLYGGFACARAGIIHYANVTGLGSAFEHTLLRRLVLLMYRVCLRRSSTVFFENAGNLDSLVSHGAVRPVQCCLLNGAGVDTARFPFERYPPERYAVRFLFVGRIMREKGVSELLTAVRRLRSEGTEAVVTMVGPEEEKCIPEINAAADEGAVIYEGFREDVLPFYRDCDCLVLASYHEGMANVLLEAASTGRPLIASDIHGCREAVEPGVNGFLCRAGDADSLYRSMKSFCSLPYARRASMGRESRRIAEERFDRRKVIAATLDRLLQPQEV